MKDGANVMKKPAANPVNEQPIRVSSRLGIVHNTSAAVDLFGAMQRAVEMAEQRIAEEKRNGRTGDQGPVERDRDAARKQR